MISLTKEDIQELKEILPLYDSNDSESLELARTLVLTSKAFQKFDISKTILVRDKIVDDLGINFSRNFFSTQESILKCIVNDLNSYGVELLIKVELEFTKKERSSIKLILDELQSWNSCFLPIQISEMIESSSWYAKLVENEIFTLMPDYHYRSIRSAFGSHQPIGYKINTLKNLLDTTSLATVHYERIRYFNPHKRGH